MPGGGEDAGGGDRRRRRNPQVADQRIGAEQKVSKAAIVVVAESWRRVGSRSKGEHRGKHGKAETEHEARARAVPVACATRGEAAEQANQGKGTNAGGAVPAWTSRVFQPRSRPTSRPMPSATASRESKRSMSMAGADPE